MNFAREGIPFILIALALATAAYATALMRRSWPLWLLAFVLTLLVLWVAYFFRDPERTGERGESLVISPADGRVIEIVEVDEPAFLKGRAIRISVFMNVFNVHVCRAPEAGRVEAVERHDGSFRAAWHDHASEQNERVTIRLGDGPDASRFTLVAGLIARRIVCKVSRGEQVSAGQRIGLIQFGSRVDVDLPQGAEVVVSVGQRVFAGRTPIARRG